MHAIQTEHHLIRLKGDPGPFAVSFSHLEPGDGLEQVQLRLTCETPAPPPQVRLEWTHAVSDIHAHWTPLVGAQRGNAVYWGEAGGPKYPSQVSSGAPVVCLHNLNGRNRITFACSDALSPLVLRAGVQEETAQFICSVTLFAEPTPPCQKYELTLRLDTRDMQYYESLREIEQWWTSMPEHAPAPVPEAARLPVYSTWYSFHQQLNTADVERQCRLARELGCASVIVDDGWQTTSTERGYAYCGDWQVVADKITDMGALVANVHALGLKYLLWYAVPFVGRHSDAWSRFPDKRLNPEAEEWGVLDPRFPEVREYLIGIYEHALMEWDLDGFKLDFVDAFNFPQGAVVEWGNGRDIASLPEAVNRLLLDLRLRLCALKPDLLIEFRQSYMGPHMRRCANLLRAADCPSDLLSNRLRTLDLRLLCGSTPAHSDMLMWNPAEPVESAALQFLNVLFAVPQISVRLDQLPARHLAMLRFWLGFWRQQRDVLLDGKLRPLHPEAGYPVVIAIAPHKLVAAVYATGLICLNERLPETCFLINGTLQDRLILEMSVNGGRRALQVHDCCGDIVQTCLVQLEKGVYRIDVPPAGLVCLTT